ncbi:hypothetical protein GU335_07725 [Pseudolactococcus raffinolactis]|uniref:phage tail spike protein n=1 Tax=Pseudolactococcus raffinolactis TaxID=1366 RepID=UPI0014370E10|nr:phage tail spike protein [Lactococcus raffinolactis]QIW56472.1 hypothetical protein GU335_07725 [Lactococcus raffinolactis]
MINLYKKDEVDFSHNGLGSLDSSIINPLIKWHDNGAFTLEFKYPIFAKHGKDIENSSIIKANDADGSNLFFVYKVIPNMGYINVYCYQISYKLAFNAIDDTFIVSKNGQQALQQIASSTQYPHVFHFSSDIQTVANSRVVRKNVIEFLLDSKLDNSFVSRWGGHIIRQNFNIAMNESYSRDSKNYTIRHRKDLKGYNAEIDESTVTTRIRPIGYDGLMLPEIYVDSPLLNAYPEPRIQQFEYSNVKVKQKPDDEEGFATIEEAYAELRRLAKLEFTDNMVDVAHATYKVEFVALQDIEEYKDLKSLVKLKAGDTVTVIHEEDGLNIKAQIVEYSYNPLSNSYNSITLGNFQKTFSSTITKLVDSKVKEVTELAETALVSANDKNKITHGSVEPLNPKEGDSWVRPNPQDISETQWLIWDNEKWVTEMDSATQVKKGHVISEINISEEEILIQADKIHISGKTKIDDASITGAKILNLDAGKITTGTLTAISIKGVNIEGSSITSSTSDNKASINLKGGSQTFTDVNGKNVGTIQPTRDFATGRANGFAIVSNPGDIFSINAGNANNSSSRPVIQIPANANEDNVTANFFGQLKFENIQPLDGRDIWVVSPSGRKVVLGVAGNSKLIAEDGGVAVFGNFSVFNGSKNAVHVTRNGLRATPAYEMAESYLGDIGRSYTREDYEVWVHIDELFSDTVNTDIPYEVFLQAYSDARFWVEDFKSDKFLVKSDKPFQRFAYEIKAKRRGYENERLVEQKRDNEEIEKIYMETEIKDNG